MKEDVVVIGGGVAGLCSAIRLSELGASPLVIEGGTYPSHKVCGEFLSPECLPLLKKWNIETIPILNAQFQTPSQVINYTFPEAAGSLSHHQLDPSLAQYAKSKNVEILTESRVMALRPKQSKLGFHEIELSTGKTVQASTIIVATGRIPNFEQPFKERYIGLKAHFEGISIQDSIQMFSFPGAYLGISQIENHKYNIACLATVGQFNKFETPELFMKNLMSQNTKLNSYLSNGKNLFKEWMKASVPEFGLKKTPNWKDAYFIGDAIMTIPPTTGEGLSMGILGGYLAAEYAFEGRDDEFKKKWLKQCSSQIFWGKILHHIMLNPTIGNPCFKLGQIFPSLIKKLFYLTRHKK
ncbi:MAG: NAD(P)-binding domain-containing protein [Parachlamydiaceae bacterium]|nr:NAD(P)-binding domain-containing protein [Parachlamydiaceae bacterium]